MLLKDQAQNFEKVSLMKMERVNLTGSSEPERIIATWATADFFGVFGVQPHFGRTFMSDEGQLGKPMVVVVSHSFWQNHLNSDPNFSGRSINLNDKSYTVIGVMPQTFTFIRAVDVWPILQVETPKRQGPFGMFMVGKLKPNVSLEQVNTELALLHNQMQQQFSNTEPQFVWC